MKKIKIIYWAFTGPFVLTMLASAIGTLKNDSSMAVYAKYLGYPLYLFMFLAVAKISGVIAILFPRFPKLKEWAYAGFCFDLLGAMYSHIAVGDSINRTLPMLLGLVLLFGSYIFFHKRENQGKPAS